MVWIIVSAILFIIAFIVLGFKDILCFDDWGLNPKQLGALLTLLIMIPAFVAKVPANSVGIKYSPFNGTSETTLNEGFHAKNPFDKVYKISTEVQTMKVENLTTQTEDAQFVTTILDVKYRVNPTNAHLIFTQFRTLDKMSETLIIPTTQRVLELITTRYNVMDVLGDKRSVIYSELESELTKEFAKYGVEFYSISITDMDAGDAIENAITAEAVAKKQVETAEQELLKAQTEAKKAAVSAQAEQDAAKIKAETKLIEAEAQKKANELLQQSLTELILQQQWINKWNGEMPKFFGGDGAGLMFNMGSE